MKKIMFLIIAVCLSACLKEETPVAKRTVDGDQTAALEMGSDYRYQIFFNFSENKIIEKNIKYTWDIGFETGVNGWHVITNTSKYMFVFRTNETELSNVMDHSNCTTSNHHYDMPSGNLDSTGIGDWKDGYVRIIDLGTDENGTQLGWYKLKIDSVDANQYYIQYAKINASTAVSAVIQKHNSYTFTYFSLLNNEEIVVAPKSTKWDVVFTQYIKHLTTPAIMDYLVTGCILNHNNTLAALVTEKSYVSIDLAYAESLNLTNVNDVIGYDWKDIGLDQVMNGGTAEYTIYPNKSYVIKDQNGNYFKLRFTDFYSKTGEKGTPTFEYEQLKQ